MVDRHLRKALDLSMLVFVAIVLVSYCFGGVTSNCDGMMHLSKVKIMLENLDKTGVFPRWNPYWYFGVPMWRIYPPLSYYIVTVVGWVFHLSLLQIVMLWTYIAFSVSAVSTYFLAQEMGLERLGRLTSSILFLTSFNLITYWGIGSYPNITGIAFSPLAISLYIRALKTRTLPSILVAGTAFAIVLLTYFMYAIIVMIFILIISVEMALLEPSLLLVSKGLKQPPKYTLVLPRILFFVILIAGCLSMWWALPFVTTYLSAPEIPGESGYGVPKPLMNHLIALLGIHMNMDSPGIGHFVLAVTGCLIVFVKRGRRHSGAAICFIVAFILSMSPWLRIPTGPLFWWRFTLYMSLFASVCGGIALDSIKGLYQRLLDQASEKSLNRWSSGKLLLDCTIALILVVSVYPVVSSAQIVFQGFDISERPGYVRFLEREGNLGERIAVEGVDGGYDLNVYGSVPQSGGGNVHYVYMVNEFAYSFWYHVIYQKDARYLPYFARSYNVRWLGGVKIDGAEEVYPGICEVEGFDSSLAEVIGPETLVALFIGDHNEYSDLFTSIAMVNRYDIIPVYGGAILDDLDLETLQKFHVVYLHGLRYNAEEGLGRVSSLLSDYVEGGGGLILDTGDPVYGRLSEIPEPFPVGSINLCENSNLRLEEIAPDSMAEDVNLTRFATEKAYTTSFAESVKEEAIQLIRDDDRPAVIFWSRGRGRAMWTGLRLPYLTMLDGEEEVAKLLVNMLRFAASAECAMVGESAIHVQAELPSLDEIVVEVKNASSDDALWVKMSYHSGWTAEIQGVKTTQLKIFQAGPGMMMVFPEKEGDFLVRFVFAKDAVVQIGEAVSLAGVAAILIPAFFCCVRRIWTVPRGWARTHHAGSGLSGLRRSER